MDPESPGSILQGGNMGDNYLNMRKLNRSTYNVVMSRYLRLQKSNKYLHFFYI